MRPVLVIDTCGAEGYVALISVEELPPSLLGERSLRERATQEELLPAIALLQAEAEIPLADLVAVAVVAGPGSFTGVRIGLATAKGLCEAGSLPLVSLSRLAVLAEAAEGASCWAFLQAGRGDVYAARFTRGSSGGDGGNVCTAAGLTQPGVRTLQQATAAAGRATILVTEEPLVPALPDAVFVSRAHFLQALRSAAAAAVREKQWSDVALTDAIYLRVPDAELALRAKQQ